MNKIRKVLNKIAIYIIIFFIAISILQILGVLACAIPKKMLNNNKIETARQLYELGEKYKKKVLNKNIVNFYFTDILMTNITYSVDNQKPLESFILARKNYNGVNKGYVETMGKDVLPSDEYINMKNGTAQELLDFVDGKEIKKSFEYSRYWNGYLLFLRPLLCIMDYKKIIILLLLLTLALITVYSIEIYKHSNIYMVIAFIIPLILTDMFFSMLTINANICFIIAIISSIIVMKNKKENINAFLFFVIGILTNFFDLLTLPILTVGYPLISFIILYRERKDDKILTKEILINLFSWILGYAMCWASKWIITDAIFNKNIILNAINQIIFRTSGNGVSIKYLILRIIYCLGYFNFVLMLLLILIYYIRKKERLYYSIVIYMPIIWLFVLKNHSIVHAFFTYKELQITMFAVMCAILDNRIIKNDNKRKNKNAIKK